MLITEFTEPIGSNTKLNPKLWQPDQQNLHPEVRDKLIKIANKFVDYVDLDQLEVLDIVLTGAQANYTYGPHSDLDLHLIVDWNSTGCGPELQELFQTKRKLFGREHQITIRGIPVEPGAEAVDKPLTAAAYSLIQQQWLRKPGKPKTVNRPQLLKQQKIWQNMIDLAEKTHDLPLLKSLLKLLRRYRKWGLSTKKGEYSTQNLTYKSLRNSGQIEKLQLLITRLEDQQLTIKERK